MDLAALDLYSYVYLPMLVFVARFVDVTLMTLRIIFVSRGKKKLAPLLGFVEVFIWIAVVTQIVRGANNIVAYLAYAGGFALGSYVGILIENKLAIGTLVVRIIVEKNAEALMDALHTAGYGVTSVAGEGYLGAVKLVYSVIKRKDLVEVQGIIHKTAPGAFVTIEEVSQAEMGVFPSTSRKSMRRYWRKSK